MSRNKRGRGRAAAVEAAVAPINPGDHLGDFGTDRGVIDLTFGWFGTTLRVNPGAGELELMEFLVEAEKIDVGDDASLAQSVPAMQAVFKFLRAQIHPDDWQVFYDLAKTHRQSTMDLMQVAMTIVEKVSNFPTGPSGTSTGGTATTKQSSKGGSSSQVGSAAFRRALARVPATRPDLMAAYIDAEQARLANA